MTDKEKQQLLNNPQVVDEIKRHLWIESEKAGYDIGYDNAAKDWLSKYANAWVEYHMPSKHAAAPKSGTSSASKSNTANRRAKAYL